MVTVVHIYNRWSKSELNCYVDGNLVSHTEMSWLVNTSDVSISKALLCTDILHEWDSQSNNKLHKLYLNVHRVPPVSLQFMANRSMLLLIV